MTDFEYLFEEPYELEAIVYHSYGLTELGKYTLRGYRKGMNYFFQINNLFKYEMVFLFSIREKDQSIFEKFSSILRSDFLWMVKKEGNNLEEILKNYIEDLRHYKFITYKPKNPFMQSYSPNHADYKEFEITIDRIFRMIQKIRRHQIEFYEIILQEYITRKDQYNLQLKEFLKNRITTPPKEYCEFNLNSISHEFESRDNDIMSEETYEIGTTTWSLRDLLKLTDPEIEKYEKNFDDLTRYRVCGVSAYTEGMDSFFEIFQIFKEEMSYILTKNLDEKFFGKTLTVLVRDFIGEFEESGDLKDVITDFIENLEKYEFLSLQKDALNDKISQMIYSL